LQSNVALVRGFTPLENIKTEDFQKVEKVSEK